MSHRVAALAAPTKAPEPTASRRIPKAAPSQATALGTYASGSNLAAHPTAASSPGFADVPIRHSSATAAVAGAVNDQSPPAGGGSASPSVPPVALPPRISSINIVDSPAGAISGYTAITSGDLNTPGPYNHPSNGGVSNVHQVHFTLSQGDSAAVTPRREIQRSAWYAGAEQRNPADQPAAPGSGGGATPGGFGGKLVGPDGPAAHEVKRPTTDKIVVADAPGAAAIGTANFPFIYRSHFSVTLATAGVDFARISYDVRIEKKDKANVPNVENSVAAVDKADLIVGRSLK
jgi:hypothetical protein